MQLIIHYKDESITVDEADGVRRLSLNGQCQGRMNTDGTPASDYMKEIILYMADRKHLKDVLVIGGGAFLIPNALSRFGCNIDVVEPNMKIIDVASQFFGNKKSRGLYIAQAQDIIDTFGDYDCIILDAYAGSDVVNELYSEVYFEKYFHHLNIGGMLITNDTRHGYSKVQYYVKE